MLWRNLIVVKKPNGCVSWSVAKNSSPNGTSEALLLADPRVLLQVL
jgi:hypothetical protein